MDYPRASETRDNSPPNGRPHDTVPDADLDALADLFLGPAAGPTVATSGRPAPQPGAGGGADAPLLEALIVGHLPISASAWPGQYARRRAEQAGAPVGVVRLSGGLLTIDLLGAPRHGHTPADDADALSIARAVAGVLILRADEASEEALAGIPALGRVCLLTGADDAAVVACYRKLKALSAACPGALADPRLAIMGADEPRALLAHERIAKAAKEFLDAEMREPVVIERIGPTGSTPLFRGASELSLEDVVALLNGPAPARLAAPEPDAPVFPTSGAMPAPERPCVPSAPSVSAAPPRRPEPSPRVDRLSAFIRAVRPLTSRCPLAPGVELAVDDDGRLQLIAGSLSCLPAGEVPGGGPIAELVRAGAWADSHAALLARAEPSVRRADAVLHLVTDDARLATGLAGSMLLRVHLAVPAAPVAYGMAAVALDAR